MTRSVVAVLRCVASLGAVALAAQLALAAPAGAVGVGGSQAFGVTPVLPAGTTGSYFQLALSPGQTRREAVRVSNASSAPLTLRLGASVGVTASNSGSAYSGAFAACASTACWIENLPPTLTLAAGTSKVVDFEVAVPPGAAPGQYLAGISAEPVSASAPVKLNSRGGASASAVIVDDVTVGVAITVGSLAQLPIHLTVTHVASTYVGTTPRLLVTVRNDGSRFAHGSGLATCRSGGRQLTFPVVVGTILPGDSAVVPVNAVGLAGTAASACEISFTYSPSGGTASDQQVVAGRVAWSGSVRPPGAAPPKQVEVGPGVYRSIPASKLPGWVIALLAAAGAIVLALAVTVVVIWRRRRARPAADGQPTPGAVSAPPLSGTTPSVHERRAEDSVDYWR